MELHEVASQGVVSSATANELGVDAYAIRQMVKAGQLRRLIRGWYAVRAPGLARPPWEGVTDFDTARLRHRLLTIALLRSFEGRVVASHQSALVLHGVGLWRADLELAHVSRVTGDHTRHRPHAIIHPESPLPPVLTSDQLWTVPVAVAVVQIGLYPPDLSTRRRPFESLVAADGALHHGLVTLEQLEEAVELHRGHPGIDQVRRLLGHADGSHESAGETRLADILRRLGYRFTAQVTVTAGGRQWRVDFMLGGELVIIEFDGLLKYDGVTGRDALAAEKWREDQLRGAGHQVVRVVWSELDSPELIGARIDEAIARARLAS